MKNAISLVILTILTVNSLFTQSINDSLVSEKDILKAALRPERTCYDVLHYRIDIEINPAKRMLSGKVDIVFKALEDFNVMQIDLYENMEIHEILYENKPLIFDRKYDAVFVTVPDVKKGKEPTITVIYSGQPTVAKNAPWDGGFVWKTDKDGNPWVGVACQGDGASLWWPCKDHLSDEPNTTVIKITVPDTLQAIANGRLITQREEEKGKHSFTWAVSYPINSYNINVNVGNYFHFNDTYTAKDGSKLDLDYYVLPYNLEKAKKHFKQVHGVLGCFEEYFGKYPFWEDGYKLIETSYLGMEHQSAIAYGNLYRRGYLGDRIPKDMNFDYIILHETGHEYFGNSVSASDLADMWIHESFTTYMEALYVECQMSYSAAVRYLEYQRPYIRNEEPIIGVRGVNWYKRVKTSDQYYKGSWVLHTLRGIVDDDVRWKAYLNSLYKEFEMRIIISEDILEYTQNYFKEIELGPFFRQYLYRPEIPAIHYKLSETQDGVKMQFQMHSQEPDLKIPVKVRVGEKTIKIFAENKPQSILLETNKSSDVQILKNLYLLDFFIQH